MINKIFYKIFCSVSLCGLVPNGRQARAQWLGVGVLRDIQTNFVMYTADQSRRTLITVFIFRLCVNNLSDSSIEVLAEELCKHKVVVVLG